MNNFPLMYTLANVREAVKRKLMYETEIPDDDSVRVETCCNMKVI
jgi:hypothetical protein